LKAREPARILIAIGNKKDNRWHLQITTTECLLFPDIFDRPVVAKFDQR